MSLPADPGATGTDDRAAPLSFEEQLLVHLDRIERYLGGILGILQSQEGAASMLGDLAPMLMSALMGSGSPAGQPTIEGGRLD